MTIRIDLANDDSIEEARLLIDQLVGAHLGARNDEELLHMVNFALGELNQRDRLDALRLLVHSAYYAQSLIVDLLDLHARCSVVGSGLADPLSTSSGAGDPRLLLWDEIRTASVH